MVTWMLKKLVFNVIKPLIPENADITVWKPNIVHACTDIKNWR